MFVIDQTDGIISGTECRQKCNVLQGTAMGAYVPKTMIIVMIEYEETLFPIEVVDVFLLGHLYQ